MASKYLGYAQTTADILTKNWFGPAAPNQWVYSYQDFWRTPNVMTALNSVMELTGEDTWQSTLDNGLTTFQGVYAPGYYDDEAWWGAAFMRIFDRTKNQSYLNTTETLFQDLNGGWDDTAYGGVWFKRSPKSYPDNNKNSASTTVYFEIAGRLYNATGTSATASGYLDDAKQAWAWLPRLIDQHSLVWGNLVPSGDTFVIYQNNPPRPYTQGVPLQGLLQLWLATKDDSLIDSAIAIADVTIASMVWPGSILRDTYEVIGDYRPTLLDPILFKPIFVRYLGEFAVALSTMSGRNEAVQRYTDFLRNNADAVWTNYPQGIFGMDWHLSQPDYKTSGVVMYDGCLQSAAVDLFVAAARVDALTSE
jgi:predicted alpha-1,6-mannanase (GH76 family)